MSQQGQSMEAYIIKDSIALVRADADGSPTNDVNTHGSAFVITECMQGQSVWVSAYRMGYLQEGYSSHFSGHMLKRQGNE